MSLKNVNENISIIKGTIPVLLSAPHAHSHFRPNLSGSYKHAELHTDDIVKYLCEATGCWGILSTGQQEKDPSSYDLKENQYKLRVNNICDENKIKAFIDIHGLSDKHLYDLGVIYVRRFNKSHKLAREINNASKQGMLSAISTIILNVVEQDKRESLIEFVTKEFHVPAVQIEIAKYIREDEALLFEFAKNLSSYILKNY